MGLDTNMMVFRITGEHDQSANITFAFTITFKTQSTQQFNLTYV